MPTSFRDLWQRPIEPVPEYIEGGILGKRQVLLLAAPVDSYKSVVALNMAHSLASGTKLFNYLNITEAVKVLYLDAEVGRHYFQSRLKLFYDDLSQIPENAHLETSEDEGTQFHIDRTHSLGKLKHVIERVEPNVIILDCLNPFLSDEEGEQTFSRAASNISTLQHEFSELELSFVIVHHMREIQQGTDPLSWYNIRGHGKLVDWPASRITMFCKNKSEREARKKLAMRFLLRHGPGMNDIGLVVKENLHVTRLSGLLGL